MQQESVDVMGLESAINRVGSDVGPAVAVEHVFSVLDGAHVDVDGDDCVVEVLGVHDEAGRRYVQLALAGPHPRLLTVSISSRVQFQSGSE